MKNQKSKILGLDISTSITGASVVEGDKIVECLMWDTRNKKKFPTLYDKANFVKQELQEIKNRWHIDEIFIEQSLQKAGVSIKRGENSKEKVLKFILDNYPEIDIEYTKHGNPKPGSYDICDSIIIALAGNKIARET
jgi:hypothetical protein